MVTIGWSGFVNGELLARAEKAEFDVLLTFYSGIPRDHDIAARQIAVYVIQPEGQGPAATCAMIERIKIELRSLHPGQVLTLSNRTGKRPLA